MGIWDFGRQPCTNVLHVIVVRNDVVTGLDPVSSMAWSYIKEILAPCILTVPTKVIGGSGRSDRAKVACRVFQFGIALEFAYAVLEPCLQGLDDNDD